MSYLHTPRLVFTGDFLSDVSTVNNDPAHYNNKTFEPSFQEPELPGQSGTNGWWNPEGGAVFDFQNCTVKKYVLLDGTEVSDNDDLIGQIVKGADGRATGKMVDLDPQQQSCSELWSVRLRILTKNEELLVEGEIEVTGFRDLQYRQHAGIATNGQPLGAPWTSVLTNLNWGTKADDHLFFRQLKSRTEGNRLSINLNAFGYYYNHAPDGRFSLGRVLGAIGPYLAGEPETLPACRRVYGISNQGTASQPQVYFCDTNALYQDENMLTVDFGGSFPVSDALGSISFDQTLWVAVAKGSFNNLTSTDAAYIEPEDFVTIGQVPYETGADWLMNTGGIVSFHNIPDAAKVLLPDHQILLITKTFKSAYQVLARESIQGYYVRADNYVQRLNSGQTSYVDFYAYQWGKPLSDTYITASLQPPTPIVPKSEKNPISWLPGNNYPQEGISFSRRIRTDRQGHAQMTLTGNAIDNPRKYIEGQIYFLDYQLMGIEDDPANATLAPDNISIHLYNHYEVPDKPTWEDIATLMTQYSNLYPIMSKYLVDLSDPEALITKKDILIFAFSRPIKDPIYMPATRDLSEARKKTILKWLKDPILPKAKKKVVKAAPADISEATPSPAALGQELTEKQAKLKLAMRAKSGKGISFDDQTTLKY